MTTDRTRLGWLVVVSALLCCMYAIGLHAGQGDARHGHVELVCHPVEGDTTGARVCVVP